MENNESWKHEGKNWYLLRYNQISLKRMLDQLEQSGLEHFLPSYTVVENRRQGTQVRVARSLMFNMMFIHSSLNECVQFVINNPGVNFMVKPSEEHPSVSLNQLTSDEQKKEFCYDKATFRYVITVPDRQMEMFIKAVTNRNTRTVPFMKPTEIDLEKGDKVRIVGGPYDGIEGILESQKGKDGGTVYVHILNFLATRTTEIRPEFIQIIEFAKSGKHMYKKFDSFMTRGHRCVVSHIKGEKISARDNSYLNVFVHRFSDLQTPTVNMTAKLHLFLFIAYTCLGRKIDADVHEKFLQDYMEKINSESMRLKCLLYLYGCTGSKVYRKQIQSLTKLWRKNTLDSKKQEIKDIYLEFEWIWNGSESAE